MTKTCCRCHKEKDASEFYRHHKNGLQYQCKPCKNLYSKTHYQENKGRYAASARRRKPVIQEFWIKLKDKPCADCGKKFHYAAMDFDHLDPKTKIMNPNLMKRGGRAALLNEIAKCELVCACCHRIRTWKRQHESSRSSSSSS